MRNRLQLWVVTFILFGVASMQAAFAYLAFPDRSTGALVDWSLVALWLVVPLGAVWRQLRGRPDTDAQRHAAIRLAIVGYVPLLVTMRLVSRLIE
jgi:hypothetical protein